MRFLLADALTRLVEEAGAERGAVDLQVPHLAQRRILRDQVLGESERAFEQVALHDLVDHPRLVRGCRGHRIARDDDIERGLHADQPRQTLRTAGARENAELDLGQADLSGSDRHAVVTRERDLEPAAERGAMQRGHDRLFARFDGVNRRLQRRLERRLAELGDVGAGHESAARAQQDRGFERRIRGELRAPSISASRTPTLIALTGGFSITMIPISPRVSNRPSMAVSPVSKKCCAP